MNTALTLACSLADEDSRPICGERVRILIADDSIVSRHLLEATLRKWGYDVMVAWTCFSERMLRR
jgi:PleD family two-component response regulator